MQTLNHSTVLLRGPVPMTHLFLQRYLQPGCLAVDATCGNGKDTLEMARLVGEDGHIWGIDIQQTALDRTSERLQEAGMRSRVTLINAGHQHLPDLIQSPVHLVVFNLGWLPGGAKELVTQPDTTLQALQGALGILRPGGLLLITCYPGHDGGATEAAAVADWCSKLPSRSHHVWQIGQLNVAEGAPFCLLVQDSSREVSAM